MAGTELFILKVFMCGNCLWACCQKAAAEVEDAGVPIPIMIFLDFKGSLKRSLVSLTTDKWPPVATQIDPINLYNSPIKALMKRVFAGTFEAKVKALWVLREKAFFPTRVVVFLRRLFEGAQPFQMVPREHFYAANSRPGTLKSGRISYRFQLEFETGFLVRLE